MNTVLLVTLAIAAVAGLAGFMHFKHLREAAQPSTFRKRRPLTTAEQTLYWRLTKMLPDHVILAQIPVTRCISVKGPAYERLRTERLDFVICSHAMQVVAAIELSSKNSSTSHRQKRDALMDEAFDSAGIHLIRWPSDPIPSEAYVAMEIGSHSLFQTRLAA